MTMMAAKAKRRSVAGNMSAGFGWPARIALLLGSIGSVAIATPAVAQDQCSRLRTLLVDGATITAASTLSAPASPASETVGSAPYCRVDGYLSPTRDSRIGFEIWLPAKDVWNGRLQAVGNGGLLGALNEKAMIPGRRRGYATMTTDLGHINKPAGAPEDPTWAIGHPDRIVDYAYRGEHLATLASKRIVAAFYGRPASHAFYSGCSAGGIQGLSELLRYPRDYDGYLIGAATPDHLGQEVGAMWNTLAASLSSPADALLASQAAAIHDHVLRECAGRDGGAPGDVFLTDPSACKLDVAALRCSGSQADGCLSAAQVAIVNRIYGGPVDPRSGSGLFSGLTPGSELGWARFFLGRKNPIGLDRPWAGFMGLMAYQDPTYLSGERYLTFDFGKDLDWVRGRKVGGETLDSSWNVRNRDLDAFQAAGGKIIQYHGWDDPNIPPLEAVHFRQDLLASLMTRRHLTRARASEVLAGYYRLFMVPGMGHCSGGAGPDDFGQDGRMDLAGTGSDPIGALERWVDGGEAPTQFVASHRGADAKVEATRPICSFPKVPAYAGSGDPKLASSFSCSAPRTWPTKPSSRAS